MARPTNFGRHCLRHCIFLGHLLEPGPRGSELLMLTRPMQKSGPDRVALFDYGTDSTAEFLDVAALLDNGQVRLGLLVIGHLKCSFPSLRTRIHGHMSSGTQDSAYPDEL